MHTHERTLLAQLGFADLDRQQTLHDLACQYLSTPETLQRLADYLEIAHGPTPQEETWICNSYKTHRQYLQSQQVSNIRVTLEYEISKGQEKYRSTIGFADLALAIEVQVKQTNVQERQIDRYPVREPAEWSDWQAKLDGVDRKELFYGIEVKVTPVSVHEIIRQVKLYRSYSPITAWIVATTYDLSEPEARCLTNENIRHLRLGGKFNEYVVGRQAEQVANSVEM
jgi:hypothetical protein